MTENVEKIITFASGEGNKPLGIFMDKDSIYCGKTRTDNKDRTTPVHYSTICKWELGSQARRVAQSCLLYTSPSPRDLSTSRMPSSA